MAPGEDGYNIPPGPAPVRFRQSVKGVPALEAKKGALHDVSTIVVTVPTSIREHSSEMIVAGRAHHVTGLISHLEIKSEFFALSNQVRRMVDVAHPVVGGHWLQASGAVGAAGLTVPAGLPVLLLVLPAAVVDAKSKLLGARMYVHIHTVSRVQKN